GIGPPRRTASAASRTYIPGLFTPHAFSHAESTSGAGTRSPDSALVTTDRSKPRRSASACWVRKPAAIRAAPSTSPSAALRSLSGSRLLGRAMGFNVPHVALCVSACPVAGMLPGRYCRVVNPLHRLLLGSGEFPPELRSAVVAEEPLLLEE